MIQRIMSLLCLLFLSSCAVGSAFSAYSLKSIEADGLTRIAENDLIDRVKQEIYVESSECSIIMHVTNGEESSPASK